jgi:hypothetical protein
MSVIGMEHALFHPSHPDSGLGYLASKLYPAPRIQHPHPKIIPALSHMEFTGMDNSSVRT